jgi:hypothetical protein
MTTNFHLRILALAFLFLPGISVYSQVAMEYSRAEGLIPLIEKGEEQGVDLDRFSALYVAEGLVVKTQDFKDPEWVERFLNKLSVFENASELEVRYLIPENSRETIVICQIDGRNGYVRLIRTE